MRRVSISQRPWCRNERLEFNFRPDLKLLRYGPRGVTRPGWLLDSDSGSEPDFPWHMVRQPSLRNPNAARGSWTLFNNADEVLLEGMWSAQKTGQGWLGTWTARSNKGQSFSGAWTADLANLSPESFAEMLKRTATKEVARWWRSGRHEGNWWLKGSPQQGRR